MRLERRLDAGGATVGWMLQNDAGARVWCGELSRAEFLRLPPAHQAGLRDDLGWYLVEIGDQGAGGRRVMARVCDEETGLALARGYLAGACPRAVARTAADRAGAPRRAADGETGRRPDRPPPRPAA